MFLTSTAGIAVRIASTTYAAIAITINITPSAAVITCNFNSSRHKSNPPSVIATLPYQYRHILHILMNRDLYIHCIVFFLFPYSNYMENFQSRYRFGNPSLNLFYLSHGICRTAHGHRHSNRCIHHSRCCSKGKLLGHIHHSFYIFS